MSSLQFNFILIFFAYITLVSSSTTFVAPISKHESTQLFTISLSLKTPLQSTHLLLDLAGAFTWVDCSPESYTSTSYHYIRCKTKLCYSIGSLECSDCLGLSGPGCHDDSCALFPENPVTGSSALAQVVVDSLALTTNEGRVAVVPNFVFSCSDESLFSGLPGGVTGLAGLGRGNVSLPAQVSTVYDSPYLFALCLPSSSTASSGIAIFNSGGTYYFSPEIDLSNHLIYTPLISNPTESTIKTDHHHHNPPSPDYFIEITSINVNGHLVKFNDTLTARLSTTTPYTVLETSIYDAFIRAFVNESAAMNVTVTNPVWPFDVCYEASGVTVTAVGPAFPMVDFVMRGEDAFWRILGANSMVRIVNVWCLGFVDGGVEPRSSIVIGGHQMQDNLVQFDLVKNMLGFTSSLLVYNTSCANFDFGS